MRRNRLWAAFITMALGVIGFQIARVEYPYCCGEFLAARGIPICVSRCCSAAGAGSYPVRVRLYQTRHIPIAAWLAGIQTRPRGKSAHGSGAAHSAASRSCEELVYTPKR
jgi:hypothetical protein